MQLNIKQVKKHFEKAIDKYNQNAVVQEFMAQKLIDCVISYGTNYPKILELGTGAGILTEQIVKKLQFEKFLANDLVPKSRNYLDKILKEYLFICGRAQKIKLDQKVNLIISNAMFQWFKKIDSKHFAQLLEKNGIFAFTTFSPENFKEIKAITGLSLKYKTLDEIKKELEEDFEILHAEEDIKVLKFNTPLELLAHMKNTGVNSLSQTRWSFKEVKEFSDNYIKKYPEISLTYAPITIVARKINR